MKYGSSSTMQQRCSATSTRSDRGLILFRCSMMARIRRLQKCGTIQVSFIPNVTRNHYIGSESWGRRRRQ